MVFLVLCMNKPVSFHGIDFSGTEYTIYDNILIGYAFIFHRLFLKCLTLEEQNTKQKRIHMLNPHFCDSVRGNSQNKNKTIILVFNGIFMINMLPVIYMSNEK